MAKKAQRDNAKRQPKHKTGVRKRSAPKRPRATASADAEPVREVLVDGTDNETNVPQAATDARVSEASSGDAARAPRGATAGDGARGLDFTIAGVGASAGGLEAFSKLLRAIPPTANAAIVYVQHLAPRHESSLAALLGQSTSMPVVQVTDRMPLKPGTVYVIPPNTFMSVSRGFLRLAPRPLDRSQHLPVDYFLRSLAEFAHDRAVGVILSGTDSDGAAGLREIKAVGGIALAQEPDTAKFDGMPRAAISTGAVDKILPPEEIAAEIARLAQHPLLRHVKARPAEADVPISQEQWRRIFVMLRGASGVDFTHYKQPTLRRRLQRRMLLHKIATVDQYLQYLQNNPGELSALYQDILIHVTRFFREPESYEVLTGKVFPQILRDRKGDQPIRIWVPGCSTGEEAYSVAISLLEFLGDDAQSVAVQVFATDVSESAVEQARGGLYPQSISSDISPERLRRFFTSEDGKYRISKSVRDTVIFARQDLTRDPPFSKLDLIVCRNVLIYLGPVLQKKLMHMFHYALKPSGYLMLGGSETIGPHSDLFAMADKRHKLYAKKLSGMRINMEFPSGEYLPAAPPAERRVPVEVRSGITILNEVNRVILNRYAPPGVVVDEELRIVQFRGQTGPYLEPAPGEASLSLLKMAREGLLYDLRSALQEARKSGGPARRQGLRLKYSGHIIEVNLEVIPLAAPHDRRHFLVLFEDGKKQAPVAEETSPQSGTKARDHKPGAKGKLKGKTGRIAGERAAVEIPVLEGRLLRVQQELAASREYLQSIIQDLEAANEELQSANEEILSSNEELQSTNEELDTAKEELQSTNEELNTVNEELQARNEELSRANGDLMNLLSNVQIAVVMVASDLRIRRFTPMAEKVLNLIPTDVGRPIGDIKPNLDLPDLERLIAESVDIVGTVEREAKDRQGNPYLLRIRPYKSVENRIDGAVLAFFDLEMARRHDNRAAPEAEGALVNGLLSVTREPMMVLDGRARLIASNAAFAETFKAAAADGNIGRPVYELSDGQWEIPRLHELLEKRLPAEGHVRDFLIEHDFAGLGHMKFGINARQVRGAGADSDLVVIRINLIESAAGAG